MPRLPCLFLHELKFTLSDSNTTSKAIPADQTKRQPPSWACNNPQGRPFPTKFNVTVTRKLAEPLTPEHALAWIEELEAFPCVSIETSLVKNAIEISVRYQTSYWDGAILAAAESISVPRLYSEDLNHGQLYGSVEAFNPFL